MAIGLLGRKLGMTQIYDAYGRRKAVTALQVGPCTVVGVKTQAQDGYNALQIGFQPVAEGQLNKPRAGQFKKAGVGGFRYVRELRLPVSAACVSSKSEGSLGSGGSGKPSQDAAASEDSPEDSPSEGQWTVGQQLTIDMFKDYELVDITGISIGKGFQGGMKRWNWSGGPETHGSMSHRAPGAISSGTTPGRVFRGHHLPGHMGARRVTIQNLRIMRRDLEHHLLLLEGGVPGNDYGLVLVHRSVKQPGLVKAPAAFQVIVEEEETAKTAKAAKKK